MKIVLPAGEIEAPPEFRHFYLMDEDGIVKYPAPVLRRKASPVSRITPDIEALIQRMMASLKWWNGLGIAAPQVGVPLRLFIMAPPDQPMRVILNPRIIERSQEQVADLEGCLSIPALYGKVARARAIVLKGLNRHGKPIQLTLEGVAARIAQHEIDHLDGILFIDRADPATLFWSDPTPKEEEMV
ncbi:peptide deformylase [Armatimonadetes bacterium DC]|nr:peptide deformylase [Armatimonadetes bacterium DC]